MKTKRLWITVLATLFLAAFISGCKKDNFVVTPGLCPVVLSTDPANLATGVPLDKIISATFNESMDPSTITPTSFTLQSGAKGLVALSGLLTYDGTSTTMSFKPDAKLTGGTTYTATIMNTVKDLAGNALQVNYVWTFSTGAVISPMVTLTDPANLATGVVLNKTVTATFNQAMDPLTITTSTFKLAQGVTSVAGTVSYASSFASFKPTSALTSNTVYTATLTTGAAGQLYITGA